jgi:hypothetical protein
MFAWEVLWHGSFARCLLVVSAIYNVNYRLVRSTTITTNSFVTSGPFILDLTRDYVGREIVIAAASFATVSNLVADFILVKSFGGVGACLTITESIRVTQLGRRIHASRIGWNVVAWGLGADIRSLDVRRVDEIIELTGEVASR